MAKRKRTIHYTEN